MVVQLLLLTMDADAVPGFGLSCYCPAVAVVAAVVVTMVDSLVATIPIVDATGFGLSCYFSVAVDAATTADADANWQFYSLYQIGSEKSLFFCILPAFIS